MRDELAQVVRRRHARKRGERPGGRDQIDGTVCFHRLSGVNVTRGGEGVTSAHVAAGAATCADVTDPPPHPGGQACKKQHASLASRAVPRRPARRRGRATRALRTVARGETGGGGEGGNATTVGSGGERSAERGPSAGGAPGRASLSARRALRAGPRCGSSRSARRVVALAPRKRRTEDGETRVARAPPSDRLTTRHALARAVLLSVSARNEFARDGTN